MAIAFVQQKAEQSTSSVSSFTSTAMTVAAANSIVACMSGSLGTLTTLVASDSKVDAYTLAAFKAGSSLAGATSIYVARTIAGGSTTFTVTPSSACFCSISAQEYSGMAKTPPGEATNSAGPTSSTAVNPGAVNPATANDLYVASWTHDGSVSQAFTFNVSGEGWNQRANLTNTADQPLGSQDLVATGSKTGSATLGTAANWVAAVATFRPAVLFGDNVTVHDAATVAENAFNSVDNDNVTVHDAATVALAGVTDDSISASDNVTVHDAGTVALDSFNAAASDNVTVHDAAIVAEDAFNAVGSDNVTVHDAGTVAMDLALAGAEGVAVHEGATVFADGVNVAASDNVTVHESASLAPDAFNAVLAEGVAVHEAGTVVAGGGSATVAEGVAVHEQATAIFDPNLALSDNVTVHDAGTVLFDRNLLLSDNVTVHDAAAAAINPLNASASDNVTVHDAGTASLDALNVVSSDNVTVHDAGAAILDRNLTLAEGVAVHDAATAMSSLLAVAAAEAVIVADSVTKNVTPLFVAGSEKVVVRDNGQAIVSGLDVNVVASESVAVHDQATVAEATVSPVVVSGFWRRMKKPATVRIVGTVDVKAAPGTFQAEGTFQGPRAITGTCTMTAAPGSMSAEGSALLAIRGTLAVRQPAGRVLAWGKVRHAGVAAMAGRQGSMSGALDNRGLALQRQREAEDAQISAFGREDAA